MPIDPDHVSPSIKLIDVQPALPSERFLVAEPPDAEAVPMDVVFVGGGPAGLAGAIELARLVQRDREAGGTLGFCWWRTSWSCRGDRAGSARST